MDTTQIALRSHVLCKMDCPSVARASLVSDEEDPTAAQEKGTTAHALTFGTQRVVVFDGALRRGVQWDRFEAQHAGQRIVLKSEYEIASRMADAVKSHPIAGKLLDGAVFEQTWLFDLDGRKCRATPDVVGCDYIADLKTGRSAHPRRFAYACREYFYDATMAWYMRAIPSAQRCYVIVVEKTKPYPVSVFRCSDRMLAQGNSYNDQAFKRFRQCERTNVWPDYSTGIVQLDVPERMGDVYECG